MTGNAHALQFALRHRQKRRVPRKTAVCRDLLRSASFIVAPDWYDRSRVRLGA